MKDKYELIVVSVSEAELHWELPPPVPHPEGGQQLPKQAWWWRATVTCQDASIYAHNCVALPGLPTSLDT